MLIKNELDGHKTFDQVKDKLFLTQSNICHHPDRIEFDGGSFDLLYIQPSRQSQTPTWQTAHHLAQLRSSVWWSRSKPRSEECLPKMERRRDARRAEGVNPLEGRSEASSKGAKVRWRHAILMERGEGEWGWWMRGKDCSERCLTTNEYTHT